MTRDGGASKRWLRTEVSKRRLLATAREWKNPNWRSIWGSSRSHGLSRESSLRWIMVFKSMVVIVVEVSWIDWL